MKHLVIFGAGKSSIYLIEYVIAQLVPNDWRLTVLDADIGAALDKTRNAPHTTALAVHVEDEAERQEHIAAADIVISLLPPSLHYLIALDCLRFSKHLLTASYIDPRIATLRTEIESKKLLFLCEMGLDPGIDHMSAMRIIHSLQEKNASIVSFRSHCGGLTAPESDNNPWRYKVSWNPRNVVLAGKSGAIYREHGHVVQLAYEQLFDPQRKVEIKELGQLSYYPNRDSLSYIDTYRLHDASEFIRTTLRYPEFCVGWKKLVELKLTDENIFYDTDGLSIRSFFEEHFKTNRIDAQQYSSVIGQLNFLGLNDTGTIINKGRCSAADVLQFMLEKKLALKPNDKDMIVMLHEFEYLEANKLHSLKSSLIVKGENSVHTAMSKTVGLPLGIAARLILQKKIAVTGLHIPIIPEIYQPVLEELETLGIKFTEYQ